MYSNTFVKTAPTAFDGVSRPRRQRQGGVLSSRAAAPNGSPKEALSLNEDATRRQGDAGHTKPLLAGHVARRHSVGQPREGADPCEPIEAIPGQGLVER